MKNLVLYEVSHTNYGGEQYNFNTCCFSHDEGNNTGDLYIFTYNLIVNKFNENGLKWSKDLSECVSKDNKPLNLTFLSLPNVLCVALENGELFTISDDQNSCDLVGVFDSGLLAMEWSPDQELVVLVTKDLKTILMSCTYDPIHEESLLDQEFGDKQFITVGWGKKETQFHGSEGKQARVQSEVSADPSVEDSTIKITWRGDGNLYAIGFTMDGIKRFKVFDRDGILQYTSEKQQGLEYNLSWRPSGNVIATTQRNADKSDVAFFEKNGLKHGGFNIPVNKDCQVEDLIWSSDSEILAIQVRDAHSNNQKLLLFTISNYHWYLKQTLEFNSEQQIIKVIWDNNFDVDNNKKLHVILQNSHYTYSWIWNVDHSVGCNADDNATVAVIDGKKVLLTCFRQTVIPPPMAGFEIEVEGFVNSVHFSSDSNVDPNSFMVCTSDCKLIFYETTAKNPLIYKASKCISLEKYKFPFQYYNWYWWRKNTIVAVKLDNSSYNIVEYDIEDDRMKQTYLEPDFPVVTRINGHPTNDNALFFQTNNGDVLLYNRGKGFEPQDVSFSVFCPQFNVVSVDSNIHFLALSHKGNFYVDDIVVLNNVNSFYVHTKFLLLTTLQHVLLCFELTKLGLSALMDYQKNASDHVYKRKVERGSKLVIVVPNDTRTILQMPRGNLETIQPRPLSLKIIGEYLNSSKYYEAFDLMRKQRINLNLIYDHNPEIFEKNIDIFLDTINNNSWLSLFISDLENIDVTKSMYASSYAEELNVFKLSHQKIQKICSIIRDRLSNRQDKDSKILPLLTSYVKTNTIEDLELALEIIKELKIKESKGEKLAVGSDEAIKYLLYMVNVNNLFDVALGMYDFSLVLLVANKSQKDPKEFIPLLNEFDGMEENYKKFMINKHLKRFDRAVKYLAICGSERHEELKTFVKYHSLYREALKLFDSNEDVYKQISDDFGLYLRLKKENVEAGIVYERAGKTDKAVACYKDALEWELAIKLASQWPTQQLKDLCRDLITSLKEAKRHQEALTILEKYYDEQEETIIYAIENRLFKSAIRLCSQYNKEDLKDKNLVAAVLEESKNTQEQIETNWTNFNKHKERLLVVRENKIKNPVEIYDPSFANKDCDLYSDIGSTIASSQSRSSSRTFRSSKNRRKHERKVASLKEGSQYEDVALVMALHSLVSSSYDMRLPVKELNIALLSLGKDRDALTLQVSLDRLLREIKDNLKVIWTHEFLLEATNASIAAQNLPEGTSFIPQGIASLEPHVRIAPVLQDISWKLDGLC